MRFNHYQKLALKHYKTTNQSIAIKASAGSGKTTFIRGTSKLLKYPLDCIFLTYTTSSKKDLIAQIPDFEKQIKTTYSLGYVSLLKEFGNLKVDPLKTYGQLKEYDQQINTFLFSYLGHPASDKIKKAFRKEIVQLYDLALCHLHSTVEDIAKLYYSLLSILDDDTFVNNFKAQICHELILTNTQQPPTSITYSEMIALPCFLNILINKTQEILVDEAQDLSKAQQQLIKQTTYDNSQLIVVGDENQAIFGFAGSDTESFSNLIKMFNCKQFEMPINYRCGTEILAYANQLYGGQLSPPNMHKGKVRNITYTDALTNILDTEQETLIVSRTFKVLVELGLKLLWKNRSFSFSKNALQDKLNTTINYYQNKHPFKILGDVLESDIFKAFQSNRHYKYDILRTVEHFLYSQQLTSYAQLKRHIDIFFNYAKHDSNLLLSTIHSAKGLEAHTVYHFGHNNIPHKLCTTVEQLQQEKNLDYVARTRAKHNYYLVEIN